jgi:tetratricopeptide (TPR) repeat protein
MKGDISGAIDECEKARQLNDRGWSLALLARAYAVSGRRTEAIAILEQLHEIHRRQNLNAYDISYVYAALGDKEQALHYLEKSYQAHEGFNVGHIRVDPFLDPLRSDPRFEELVAKVFAPKNTVPEARKTPP